MHDDYMTTRGETLQMISFQAREFSMTGSELPTKQNVCSRRVSCKWTPAVFSSLCEKPRGDMEHKPPPVPAQGFKSNSDKMLGVQQPPFLICGANIDEKVVSGRSTSIWRVFIRYYNLSLLQGRGEDGSYLHLISWPGR